ncbi:hypothetical protein QFZ63_003939 [Streptomyces sp. B3I7]|uniref:DUF4328 domain-containing protein n=1 Tax=unclassified Streptomyces TaxID=2593676 RepID=UPI00278631C4|nr:MULTISPECIES: DUF4328 domain-containing protein [unclassified Streptomyces]MDQ0788184.1 hypothetical protein [Streptomyces sp. B3I8]MDQ0812225.1 hypothetical protein [Streptomyces sp. B3I7]
MNEESTRTPALRPTRGAAHCAVAALALAGAAWTARAGWQIRLGAAGMPDSGPPDQGGGSHRPLTSLEDGYHLVTTVGDAAAVLCAVAFLSWLWAVRDNARALSGEPPRYSWVWVYLGWVLPVANLWIPRGILADIHRRSAPGERLPRAVNWWWGLWLAGTLTGTGLMYTVSTDKVVERAYDNPAPLLAADAAVVGAAVAGILVVRALTAAQRGSDGRGGTAGTLGSPAGPAGPEAAARPGGRDAATR